MALFIVKNGPENKDIGIEGQFMIVQDGTLLIFGDPLGQRVSGALAAFAPGYWQECFQKPTQEGRKS